MADIWDAGSAGLLLTDLPPVVAESSPPDQKRARKPRKSKDAPTHRAAARQPVARIAVDMPHAHLDRPFDYLVPERFDGQARPGVRVRVRFAGQLVDGFLVERADESEHLGSLRYLDRVVSAEPVLTQEIAGLARAVADRYGGTLADVLRLAVPQRHAATETAARGPARPPATVPPRPDAGPWARYQVGQSFLDALAAGRPARAAWTALPGPSWPQEIARAALTTASAGRGVVVVVPDARDLARVDEALAALSAPQSPPATAAPAAALPSASPGYVTLTAELGPAERYRRWLTVLRGETPIVAGTRAAMFAPVRDLGLVVLWDDGDDSHAEPHAPYPNAREVLALRAHRAGAAALIGGFARTTELTQLVQAGWARHLGPDRPTLRAVAPRVRPAADPDQLGRDEAAMTSRLPALALRTAREALAAGPVLVQVPRRGYLASVACARCRAQARCVHLIADAPCNGPLRLSAPPAAPDCRWCGAIATAPASTGLLDTGPPDTGPLDTGLPDTGPGGWRCPHCGHDKLRATVTGAARTAEELGRAFPGVKVRTSGGELILARVPDSPALVIATPGAEPLADYAAALLLDGWALLSRPSLRAGEEALRRWLTAAALVRPEGTVLVHADAGLPAAQALIRWDPVTFAERDLAERAELGFPPAVRMAAGTGEPGAVASILRGIDPRFEVLGPIPVDQPQQALAPGAWQEEVRALVRTPRADGAALAKALQAAQAGRSARKEGGGVRVQLDPAELI
jgi:primosomal protein N' (replication factor Y) (superfamily II helicase)